MISADTGLNAASSRQASADILRRIAPEFDLPQSARKDFALEKNRRSLYALIAFVVLVGFAMIDGVVLNHNVLLNGKTIKTMAPLIGLLAIACYPVLTRGGVPARESWVLCMLLSIAISVAFVPLVKRADQWAAGNSTLTVIYELQEKSRFIAVNHAAPEFDYGRYREYWDEFEPGSSHEFQLIHGPFGLWQLQEPLMRERRQ
jgi:hypothetical protein